jgi:pimeloyl-ACP methyl ester carboxylesterase
MYDLFYFSFMRKRNSLPALVSLFLLFVLFSCIHTIETAQSIRTHFPGARVEMLNDNGHNLRYISIHRNDTLPTLFFLHGSPSSLSVYDLYYEDSNLAGWSNIIAADRPGYGFSDEGKSEKSVQRQAEKMWKILEKEGYPSPLYIIGSSYGGTVAARMAMLKPERVAGVVLISASLAPGQETIYKISYLIKYRWFRWMLPDDIMVANDEKLSHYESLIEMAPLWSRITAPVIMFQGTSDRLIYPENVDFASRKLTNSRFVEYHMLKNERHHLQLKYKSLILERLRNLVKMKSLPQHAWIH